MTRNLVATVLPHHVGGRKLALAAAFVFWGDGAAHFEHCPPIAYAEGKRQVL